MQCPKYTIGCTNDIYLLGNCWLSSPFWKYLVNSQLFKILLVKVLCVCTLHNLVSNNFLKKSKWKHCVLTYGGVKWTLTRQTDTGYKNEPETLVQLVAEKIYWDSETSVLHKIWECKTLLLKSKIPRSEFHETLKILKTICHPYLYPSLQWYDIV